MPEDHRFWAVSLGTPSAGIIQLRFHGCNLSSRRGAPQTETPASMGGAPKPVKARACNRDARNAITAAGMRSKFALLAVLLAAFPAILLPIAPPAAAHPKDELVIGMTQFPPTFQPNMDATLAKAYVLAMALRPFTTYNQNWQLVCMLCTELPTIENGGAKIEDLPPGSPRAPGKGIAVTFTIRPNAKWGDGTPITTDDVLFTWEVGKHPLSGISAAELYRRILSIDVKDKRVFTLHMDRVDFDYNAIGDFQIVPAHLEREAFHDPATYREHTLRIPGGIGRVAPGATQIAAARAHEERRHTHQRALTLNGIEDLSDPQCRPLRIPCAAAGRNRIARTAVPAGPDRSNCGSG